MGKTLKEKQDEMLYLCPLCMGQGKATGKQINEWIEKETKQTFER